jgi:hypothetical protein
MKAPLAFVPGRWKNAPKDMGDTLISRPASKDPGDALRNAASELESRVDTIANALMGTEEFADAAGFASQMQKGVADHMSRQLAWFNMPSRGDVAAIGERLMVMENRLARIEAVLSRLAPPVKTAPAPRKPARSKKQSRKRKRT